MIQKINIVIPMAGEGRRFAEAGYTSPKPFIDVLGTSMIEHVLNNLLMPSAQFILLARTEHLAVEQERVREIEKNHNALFIPIETLTDGMVSTVLCAREHINNETPLLIAACDQLIDIPIQDFIKDAQEKNLDGSLLTFYATHPKWSYSRVGVDGLVDLVKEKKPISQHANVGIYYYRRGADFIKASLMMIKANDRFNNEFYVAPTYNYLITNGGRVGIMEILESEMHGLGTPEDLDKFLRSQQNETS